MKAILCAWFVFLAACGDGTVIDGFDPNLIKNGTSTPITPTTPTTPIDQGNQKYIKIGSFNIAELGNPKREKDFKAIAQIINGLDLIALQEVQDEGGAEAVTHIHTELNAISGNHYAQPIVIPNAGKGFPGFEGYAFIYRDPVQLDNRISKNIDFRYDQKNHDIYGRVPAFAFFKAGTFDFVVASVHLQWSNIDKRKTEMIDIKQWLIEYANRDSNQERDFIIVGDFNRYGNLSNTVIEQHQAPFDIFVDPNELGKAYRLITLEFLPTLNTRFASLDAESTTTADSKDLYDQIIISAGAFKEYNTASSRFGEDMGVIAYDMQAPWTEKDHEAIKDAVSDHRPIWARFQIDLGDDDGQN